MRIFNPPEIVRLSTLTERFPNNGYIVLNCVPDPMYPGDEIGELHSVCEDTPEELQSHYDEADKLSAEGVRYVICNNFDHDGFDIIDQ